MLYNPQKKKVNTTLDYDAIKERLKNGPRVTSFLLHFESISRGKSQVPATRVVAAEAFLAHSSQLTSYHQVFQKNFRNFMHHLCASIPYSLEEMVRVGLAIARLSKVRNQDSDTAYPYSFYETSSADGTFGRTLAEFAGGRVGTLTDSPNKGNESEFNRLRDNPHSWFHLGCFADITPEYINARYSQFAQGFDVIWENTTFQMYDDNRFDQIAYVKRLLKDDGLFIFFEKMNHCSDAEYDRREIVKDKIFKSKYFNTSEIALKEKIIIREMRKAQVILEELLVDLNRLFEHAFLIWNSGNFYQIVASNSKAHLDSFLCHLDGPYVPDSFQHSLPKVLF